MAPSRSAGEITLETLKTIVNILEDISDDIPAPASAIIKLVQRVITTVDAVRSNREECDSLKRRLLELLAVVTMAMQKRRTTTRGKAAIPLDLKENVERLLENLKTIDHEVTKIKDKFNSTRKRHKLTSMFWAKSYTERLQKCRDDLDWAMKTFDVSSNLNDAVRLWEMSRKVETILTNQFLENLPRAKYASFDCERPDKPSPCFEGTRTAILELITDWITDPDPTAPRFFWLNGIAGVGKTTVACTIAGLMQNLGLLGGQFCFSRRGEAELRNPALVFPTIAYQLARFDPEFGRRITSALEADPEAPYASLKQQLDRLIVNPLKGLERDPQRVVVVIFDAFDECEARGAKEILQLLVAALPSLPFFLKIFVTSRPERHIQSVLVPEVHSPATKLRMTALHDIETSVVKSDILIYLRHRLRELAEEHGLASDWIQDSDIELLAEKAGDLFIHIATSIRFLSKGTNPRKQLKTLLRILGSPNQPHGAANPFKDLDKLYQEILLDAIPSENPEEVANDLRLLLGSIILLKDPLPVDALERLLGFDPDDALTTLRYLHSVILAPPPPDVCPRAYHPSFPDFLQDRARCTDDRLWIETHEHEGRMALRCLTILNADLHKGMLGDIGPTLLNSEVADLETKVKRIFTPELQYACRFWALHLAGTLPSNAEVGAALEIFASRMMLPWMESMSWLGDTNLAIRCMKDANSWIATSSNDSMTKALIYDGYRLLLAHSFTIALGAQHLAQSVLPFAPTTAALTSCYRDYTNRSIKVIAGVDLEWSALLMVWTGHSDRVFAVASSPDGSRAASGSADQTIRMWDPITGVCTSTLEGHGDWVWSVAFSPDGTQLASGSKDRTARIWDAVTGICQATMEGHSSEVRSVVFAPHGRTLASGSADCSIRLWDITTSSCIATLQGHSCGVRSITFSPDGSRLASGSEDRTIRIWDSVGGRCMASLEGHSGRVYSVIFSPSDTLLASASNDTTIRMWNIDKKSCTATLEGHSEFVQSLAFSPDGTHLASASGDHTICIWDSATSECITTFRGHSAQVFSVVFSCNGSHLISGSVDGTVRLWDTAIHGSTSSPESHSKLVTSLAFSPDRSRLISGSWDNAARIWDTASGQCITTLEGHSDWIRNVAFHPDGVRVASRSDDGTARIWNSATGECTATLQGDPSSSQSQDSYETVSWEVFTGTRVDVADESRLEDRTDKAFNIRGGRLFRGGSDDLLCVLPSWVTIYNDAYTSFKPDERSDVVAIGCENGTVLILKVSSS